MRSKSFFHKASRLNSVICRFMFRGLVLKVYEGITKQFLTADLSSTWFAGTEGKMLHETTTQFKMPIFSLYH